MPTICENIQQISSEIGNCQLVVVSKYRSQEELEAVYACGQRDLAENRVQELCLKEQVLPKDVRWHLIGHLQRNKVKYVAPFVHLIHSVDSDRLLEAIDKEAERCGRVIPFLFQVHIAQEEHKFGWTATDLRAYLRSSAFAALKHVRCRGLMGMASLTDDRQQIKEEFDALHTLYGALSNGTWDCLSMGMSSDYDLAVASGSTMVRVGSKVFDRS